MNKFIKTDVKFIKENKDVVYEDMTLNGVDVKIIFRSVDMNELTEFLSYKNFDLIVNKADTFYESINGKKHMIFPFAECRSFLWLNCVVGMDIKETNLINLIKNGVKKSRPGFWPRYNLDFSNGYMGYKLFLAIQDFNNFLSERQNVLYGGNTKIRYKFKINESIKIIVKNKNKLYKVKKKITEFNYPLTKEEIIKEWNIIIKNSVTNKDIMHGIYPKGIEKLTLTLKFGSFEQKSNIFDFFEISNFLGVSKMNKYKFMLKGKKNFYTGLYNGRYFQTWYELPYKIPPISLEKYFFLNMVDPKFDNYVRNKEGINKYNISEEKRKEILDWTNLKYIKIPLNRGSKLIDFAMYHHYDDNLMPPVKGFPSNRIVEDYDEMEEDYDEMEED